MSTGAAIRIRMYRVGFGDCFLLSVPTGEGMEHILIDCGVHPRGNIGTLERAVQNIADETQRKLALVIATHAHMDHLSGFAAFEDTFRRFQVREVWLPWTEDPNDADSVALKKRQIALVRALELRFAAKPPAEEARAVLELVSANDTALALLKSGFGGAAVTYVSGGKQFPDAAGIDGLSASILAPPRDADFLAQMDPPGSERFLRAAAGGEWEFFEEDKSPFDSWTVEADSPDFPRIYKALDERDKNKLAVAATSSEIMAFSLDQIVNNTSIVVLFTFRGKHLLFAADAQYGNWRSWIEQPDRAARLADVCFYKVAHHGSLNATPKSALNAMRQGSFAAMVSTQSKPWSSIPRQNLMDAITARASGAVRSDSISVEGAPPGPVVTELPPGFQKGEFWYDYLLPV